MAILVLCTVFRHTHANKQRGFAILGGVHKVSFVGFNAGNPRRNHPSYSTCTWSSPTYRHLILQNLLSFAKIGCAMWRVQPKFLWRHLDCGLSCASWKWSPNGKRPNEPRMCTCPIHFHAQNMFDSARWSCLVMLIWVYLSIFSYMYANCVCMYVCMYVWMYVCMNVWMYECMNVWMYECMNAWMHECMNVCMYEWMYECMNVWMYECMNVWMYECMNVWMYECMNVWMYECMNVWMYECMNVWMYECMNAWMYECMNVWMYECMNVWMYECMYVCIYICQILSNAIDTHINVSEC